MRDLVIRGRVIGPGRPAYIIAEMSANHGQDFDQAVRLVRAAKESGADAVKLQTYTPDTLTIDCDAPWFRIGPGTVWEGKRLYDLYGEASTPWSWQPELKRIAEDLGMDCFSTPFDESAVSFLEQLDVPAYKVASFELVDHPLLERIAATGRPVILSTGMATLGEIEEALATLRRGGAGQPALLKCTSAYPALPDDMHLRTIAHLADTFQLPVGLSDHTLGIAVPVAAVALGACIVEKHLTLARSAGGPDSGFSLEPYEFRAMVDAVRVAEKALGQVHYGTGKREQPSRVFRRSLFAVRDIGEGEIFTDQNVRSIRPGNGLATKYLREILGRPARCLVTRGTPLSWSHVG
jgi:N-acetylneuraminate synthase